MAILATMRAGNYGSWPTLDDFLEALRLRVTDAVAALAAAAGFEPADQKELAEGRGAKILVELAGDLRMPKGARLGGARCAMEAGPDEAELADLFLSAGDLLTDPRLGGHARRLAEGGLPAALKVKALELVRVSEEVEAFARAASSAASVVGKERVRELVAHLPPAHAGGASALFAIGLGELPAAERAAWEKQLTERCAAFKRAPAAAKRMGLVKPWPPFLPEAFAPIIRAAEEATAGVTTTDALARPRGAVGAPLPPGSAPARPPGTPPAAAPAKAPPMAPPASATRASTQQVGTRTLAPPINRGPQRKPAGTLAEGPPERLPPRNMPAVLARPSAAALEENAQRTGAPAAEAPRSRPGAVGAAEGAMPKAPLEPVDLKSKLPATVQAAIDAARGVTLADGSTYKGKEELRFDPNGKRLAHPHRWQEAEDGTEWPDPILPPSKLREPGRAAVVPGPFALRLKSLFDDRPEALDRLCAAAEARVALAGDETAAAELMRELALQRWKGRRLPLGQKARLREASHDDGLSPPARRAVEALLAALDRPFD